MPRDIALQLSTEDRSLILRIASDLGLSFVRNWPYSEPKVEIINSPIEAMKRDPDVFFLIRMNWILGSFVFNEIEGGYRAGTFTIQPRVNFCSIELYAPKKAAGPGPDRLVTGTIVMRDKPIWGDSYKEGNSVIDVKNTFDQLISDLSKNFTRLKLGNEFFLISNSSISKMESGQLLPAYDYQDTLR